jgi:uncharacterized SAM-binding protein YcdF (DUF218 family)
MIRRFLTGRIVFRVAAMLLGISVLYLVVTFMQVWRAARSDDARPSQAIVVLGAAQYDGAPSPVFEARLEHAADLYDEGIAPVVVVTGGKQEGDRFTEAAAGAEYLHARGVPDAAILRETTSRSSWESLAASARFLEERGLDRIVLVSDPFHSLRIEAIADELGLDASVSPASDSPISGAGEWWRFFSEALRVAVGRIIGFERLDASTDRVGKLVPGVAILAGPSGVV